ncbi:hypothetical protein FDP08_03395 [Marinobacter panjinensis]|uniref:ATP-grasp domain-containing protein n=1 Tax=Marinobacter panjinensis TaxID=2576384 RepID=A0A4U6R1C6_9GAMM|nr:hypothetical protein [Marinobacter panjinensis]MCR8915824.1 hypothetical protein [Marinobacter panjinensis]TKV67199.1 hypothetical protein FDP08_03395 [Marinobacter panjinensis]
MPHNEIVFACRFSNALSSIEKVCSSLKLGGEYRLKQIDDFEFSFPESVEGTFVAELILSAKEHDTGLEGSGQFLSDGLLPILENSASVLVLVRVSPNSRVVDALIEAGFKVAGSIKPKASLTERAILASFPVDIFVPEPVSPAIIVGRANANLLAQARALGECGIAVYCILTRDEPPVVARSCRYVRDVFDCRGRSDEYVVACISEISKLTTAKPVVYTGGDLDIGLLARVWETVKDWVVAPNDPVLSDRLTDKKTQLDKVAAAGVTVPQSHVIESMSDLDAVIADFRFPVICKPTELVKKGSFIGKTFVAGSDLELRKRMDQLFFGNGRASVLLQEFVPGGDECILFTMASCDESGNIRSAVTGRKLTDDGRGCIGLGETTYNPKLESASGKAFRALGTGGILAVEFKAHDVTGDLYYIESNLRAENCGSLAKAAGVNLSASTFLYAIGYPNLYSPLGHRKATWMDVSLVFLSRLRGLTQGKHTAEDRRIFRDHAVLTDALWVSTDPAPAITWYALKSFALARRVFKSVFSRFK